VKPHVVIATPVRAGEIHSASVSLGYAEMLTRLHRLPLTSEILAGSLTFAADIVRGRNRIAAKVLREIPDATHVLWLDDDQWCEDIAIIPEMVALGVDVVGAPYTNKREPQRWVHQQLQPAGKVDGPLMEAAALGFGFTLTTTSCLRLLSSQARIYRDHPHPDRVANIFGHLYYHPEQERGGVVPDEEHALLGEDYSFCLRWRRAGGQVYLYTRAGIIHHAGPHDWTARQMPGGIVSG
jgi:hypothetical protein